MESKDSLFVERMNNHINLLEICLEKINDKFKPIESDKWTDKLIKTNEFFNSSFKLTPHQTSSPPPSLPPQTSSNLKINDDDDEEEEDYI